MRCENIRFEEIKPPRSRAERSHTGCRWYVQSVLCMQYFKFVLFYVIIQNRISVKDDKIDNDDNDNDVDDIGDDDGINYHCE